MPNEREWFSSVQTLVTQRGPTSKSLSFSLYLHVESSWLASSLTRLFNRGDPRVDEKDLWAVAHSLPESRGKHWETWDSGFLQPDIKKHQFPDEAALQGFVVAVAIRFVSVFSCHDYISSCWSSFHQSGVPLQNGLVGVWPHRREGPTTTDTARCRPGFLLLLLTDVCELSEVHVCKLGSTHGNKPWKM